MVTMLFVHGTGVRRVGYERIYQSIAPRIRDIGYTPAECLWGDDYGSKFQGVALPSYASEAEQRKIAVWRLLFQDPFAELRLLESTPDAPGLVGYGEVIWHKLLHDTPSAATASRLEQYDLLNPFWSYAFERLVHERNQRWETLVKRAAQNNGEFELALSHCLVAQLITAAEEQWMPPPDGADRDALASAILTDLGGSPRGFVGEAFKMAWSLFAPFATPLMKWTRDGWSAGISPVIGDILMYQVRGEKIRGFIARRIQEQNGPVVLLAHSLGGIAAVDLLLTRDLPQVQALITVGSQSSYLYEIDGLYGLEKGKVWPAGFPRKWLNIYDTNDFLSYPGENIFPGRVKDFQSCSNQPFPESHTSYWCRSAVWKEMESFLREPE